MDLRELKSLDARRHPWELARLVALKKILKGTLRGGLRVLDLGCGDGFVARGLFEGTPSSVLAVDSNFTGSDISTLTGMGRNIEYRRVLEGDERFDLLLLLDVVEHVDDDFGFLRGLADERLSKGGRVLITVPAFNALFSRHDAFLGHRRRYNLGELERLVAAAGLVVARSGYLFSSLLAPKAVSVLVERLFNASSSEESGVGDWKGGRLLTGFIKAALDIDNAFSLALNRALGLRLPGLTGWVLCEKQR